MANGQIITLRQPAELVAWFDEYAKSRGYNRNSLFRELLEAGRDNRLVILSRTQPNPFPGDEPPFPKPPNHE